MFEIVGIDHIVLRAREPATLIAFYRDVLGCSLERDVESVGLVQLRAGNALIDIVDVAGEIGRAGGAAPGREGQNLDHLCLRIEPFEPAAIVRHLRDHGIDAGEPERRYGAEGYGPSIYLEDPEGNKVELKGPPEG